MNEALELQREANALLLMEAREMNGCYLLRREFTALLLGWGMSLALPGSAFADKAGATIQGPRNAKKGEEITIRVTFTHNSNSSSHFIEWARVLVDGKEIGRWDFSPQQLPEGPNFVREVKIPVQGALKVTAQANCNRHGSKGAAVLEIQMS